MSLSSMADARIQRERVPQASRGLRTRDTVRTAEVEGAERAGVPAERARVASRDITPLPGATDIARYVPTEAIALYIPLLVGIFDAPVAPAQNEIHDADYTGRWWLFVWALVGTAILTLLIYIAKKRSADGAWEKHKDLPVFEIVVAVVAMAAWALALPDTPLADFSWYDAWLAPVILLGTAAALPLVASALGKNPPIYVEEVAE